MTSPACHLLFALALALGTVPAFAADDHGHDHGPAAAAAAGAPAAPRFAAASDTFELVGILDGRTVTLYLDRFADNTPVTDARIDLDIGGVKLPVAAAPGGTFTATLANTLPPGLVAITATVGQGQTSDLLVGELDLHEAVHDDDAHGATFATRAAVGMAVVAAVGLLVWATRRVRAARRTRDGGAA